MSRNPGNIIKELGDSLKEGKTHFRNILLQCFAFRTCSNVNNVGF